MNSSYITNSLNYINVVLDDVKISVRPVGSLFIPKTILNRTICEQRTR